jgi:hypothetical protein
MSFADWTFVTNGLASNAEPYAPSGVIPAPSIASGSYARIINGDGSSSSYAGFVPSNASFTGVPATKAIRIQAFIRLNGSVGQFLMAAKYTPAGFNSISGYALGTNRSSAPSLFFRTPGSQTTLINSISIDVWYSFRMTVYPISPTVDRIICEQESSPGSGVWSSTFADGNGDITIDQSITPSQYVAWGGSTNNGVFGAGGYLGSPGNTIIDMMQVSLATVPVPIP